VTSPPAKLKGVPLVSAKQEINQTNDKGREKKSQINLKRNKNTPNHNYKPKQQNKVK
jgi:hypothetical protein